jgi:alpha-D-ribose 1-methylphosphonate 5-phosphate C-P lyase
MEQRHQDGYAHYDGDKTNQDEILKRIALAGYDVRSSVRRMMYMQTGWMLPV